MKRALALGFMVVAVAALVAAAAPLSGSWSTWGQVNVDPFSIAALESVLQVDYTMGTWTFSSTAIADSSSLTNLYFDVKGVLGGVAMRSIVDFDAVGAQFQSMIDSAVTAMAGVNLYALFMLDNLGTAQTPSIGSGLTLGGWGSVGSASFWAQTRFNMSATSSYIYQYGYNWLLDHVNFEVCDQWATPSTYITVQSPSCSACWSGADLYIETSFSCFTLLTQLSVSRTGFGQALFEVNDIDLGLGWLELKWIDMVFTTTSKAVNLVFDVNAGKTVCITPYLALEGAGGDITGLSLKALTLEYTWDNITFKTGDLFDQTGWSPYLNYPSESMTYQGFTWDGELTTISSCVAKAADSETPYPEYMGLTIGGDSCCGGGSAFSAFAWFDPSNSTGLFGWAETQLSLREGIGSNVVLTFGMSVTQSGFDWFKLGTEVSW